MISLRVESRAVVPPPYRATKWYQRLSDTIRTVLPRFREMDLVIIFLDEKRMREVNRMYHGQDKVTDILSFYYPGIQIVNF